MTATRLWAPARNAATSSSFPGFAFNVTDRATFFTDYSLKACSSRRQAVPFTPRGRGRQRNLPIVRYQRSSSLPPKQPAAETMKIASGYQIATNSGLSSLQFAA